MARLNIQPNPDRSKSQNRRATHAKRTKTSRRRIDPVVTQSLAIPHVPRTGQRAAEAACTGYKGHGCQHKSVGHPPKGKIEAPTVLPVRNCRPPRVLTVSQLVTQLTPARRTGAHRAHESRSQVHHSCVPPSQPRPGPRTRQPPPGQGHKDGREALPKQSTNTWAPKWERPGSTVGRGLSPPIPPTAEKFRAREQDDRWAR